MMMDTLATPWPWLVASIVCVAVGFVAASGWNPPRRRPRTTGRTITFERKKIG